MSDQRLEKSRGLKPWAGCVLFVTRAFMVTWLRGRKPDHPGGRDWASGSFCPLVLGLGWTSERHQALGSVLLSEEVGL